MHTKDVDGDGQVDDHFKIRVLISVYRFISITEFLNEEEEDPEEKKAELGFDIIDRCVYLYETYNIYV